MYKNVGITKNSMELHGSSGNYKEVLEITKKSQELQKSSRNYMEVPGIIIRKS